jgi:hypothetical protein
MKQNYTIYLFNFLALCFLIQFSGINNVQAQANDLNSNPERLSFKADQNFTSGKPTDENQVYTYLGIILSNQEFLSSEENRDKRGQSFDKVKFQVLQKMKNLCPNLPNQNFEISKSDILIDWVKNNEREVLNFLDLQNILLRHLKN